MTGGSFIAPLGQIHSADCGLRRSYRLRTQIERQNNLKAVTYYLRIRYEITSDSWATPASVVVRTNNSK